MKCYYEVLNISREADSGEIKNSYRKLALKWHPDKNLDNSDEAKEQFQLVQNAYEVLSDPQERAWYDDHREQLLRGAGSDFNDESLDLIPFFTASCFKGFEDDPKGFYAVYQEVFKKLASEETDYLDDPEDVKNIPEFGKSSTDYDQVNEFYAYWMSFSTLKSYTWLDKYDIREADNRKILKILEKENNKIRQRARKERNEEIRKLVSFVRKRDKRVINHAKILEEKAEENKRKMEEVRRQRIIKRQQELEEEKEKHKNVGVYNMNNFHEQLEEIEKHLAAEFGESEGEYSSIDSDDADNSQTDKTDGNPLEDDLYYEINQNLFCSACNKCFKTIKSFENHENSKKHRENVMNLKIDANLSISDDDNSKAEEKEANSDGSDSEAMDDQIKRSPKSKKKNKKVNTILNESDSDVDYSKLLDMENQGRKARKSKLAEKPSKTKLNCDLSNVNEPEKTEDKSNGDANPPQIDEASVSTKKPKNKSKAKEKKMSNKQKIEVIKNIDVDNLDIDTSHCCAVCKNEFTSKNRLFDHLKKTGHSIYLPTAQISSNLSAKKKKNAKNKQG